MIVNIIAAVTINIHAMPFAIIGKVSRNNSTFIFITYPKKLNISPPAITEAICPETFTPTECISKKF